MLNGRLTMPIRFRCAYCNQLMGISRKKAGSVVSCPTCSGKVVVPAAEPAPENAPAKPPEPSPFERQDFDAALFNPRGGTTPTTAGKPPPRQDFEVQPVLLPATLVEAAPVEHVILEPTWHYKAVLASAALILAALAFAAGFVLGRVL
jgi:DNA-directed RNA polymerase subunit RPC12/RpoP